MMVSLWKSASPLENVTSHISVRYNRRKVTDPFSLLSIIETYVVKLTTLALLLIAVFKLIRHELGL